ncbi:acyl CoA:acetate/3-ketoacid CoA transferase [Clostridium botulinum]|uniref:acyl CoA:acetate/3-ketoacid CoA transferase n=1 Tax=Clostridium botulinum TaxID=1491 RepID=UPI000699A47C|nr:acyl CoA:acetate/3-ketoacid CoA transferase [Clostridium botulinum]KOA94523.1 CoA-transferase [Clostridium botulinum]MCD3202634.1 acyl CoA:acetate/3-ketoacid CoA transferase [Clostridium botulinum C/D]MCD3223157.1 acyl CoA:acetate/3-ketoacid CoA transferase [Clostridium botulinum C/D]MCD3229781.1 acyl CoA:acetate/3-ketoacid CoA transferase [Clostridium botulinum C/D]MCD3273931.1 acyl CoA:acetate/3-ketoacid CoA transferase [Clostridium botulinum C/D]
MASKVVSIEKVISMIKDGDTLVVSGFVGSAQPEGLSRGVEESFLNTGHPRELTVFYAAGQGDSKDKGINHYGYEGLVKRVIGGHWALAPKMQKLAIENKIEAYNLPQGTLSQLFRDIAGGRIGTITHVGLKTFVDPRIEGGKLNDVTKEDLVKVINIEGQERLLYKSIPSDVAFIRGSYADENGNVTLEKEVATTEVLSIAQATKNSGGKVIVQVQKLVKKGTLDPRLVKVPGIYVDAIVIVPEGEEDSWQTFDEPYRDEFCGRAVIPLDSIESAPLNERKLIARRAAMELPKNAVVNLGIGIPEGVAMVANEEGIGDTMTLTVESGPIGGVPAGARSFGASINAEAILDQPYQFDFYDGGGLDAAFLGLAQCDKAGNINVSKFGPKIAGCGGFINITQNSKVVIYCGTFTAGGLKVDIDNGKLVIVQEGKAKKFVDEVEQITFSGEYAMETGQIVKYITERAVFELRREGMVLTEIAPGVDLQKDILDQMGFKPIIPEDLKLMDERIFKDELMGLK